MRATLQYAATLHYAGHIATYRKPTSGSAWDQRRVVSFSCTFQRAVLEALRSTDGGSFYFRVYFNVPQHRQQVIHFHCTVLAALCGAGICLCLFLLLNVVYLPICAKLGLVVGMTKQMSNGKEVNTPKSCRPNEVRST